MFATEAVPRLVPDQCFASSARCLVDAAQRTDFLTDVFEDLRGGRLTLPTSDLDLYGVTRADLWDGRDTRAVRALMAATATSARASLAEAERILGEITPDYRPFFRCLIGMLHQRLDDVGTRGAAVLRRPYHDAPVASLRLMVRCSRTSHVNAVPTKVERERARAIRR
jgi:phytoene synthase